MTDSPDIVARLLDDLVYEAFKDGRITDGVLCSRLIRDRCAAACEVDRLRMLLSESYALLCRWQKADDPLVEITNESEALFAEISRALGGQSDG